MRLAVTAFVITFCFEHFTQVLSDCGRPGYSRSSVVVDGKHRYPEGKVVQYRCKSHGNSLIYGYKERKCENKRWTDSIPKCALRIPGSKVKRYVRNEVIVVSTNSAAKLVGIRLKVSARVDIQLDEVKHLLDPSCTRTMGPSKDSDLPNTYIFTCSSIRVDNDDFTDKNFLILKFTHSLECRPFCKAEVDQVDLFRIARDDCYVPDRPDYGSSRIVKLNESDYNSKEVRHSFICNPDFQIRGGIREDSCPTGGDWQYPPLPECIPISTCKLPEVEQNVIIDYNDFFQRNEYVIGGVIKYSCPGSDVLVGSSVQECLPTGNWSGIKPKCVPLVMEKSNVILYVVISSVIIIPLLIVAAVILAYVCIKQRKRVSTVVSSKDTPYKYQNKKRELPKNPSSQLEAADPRYSTIERNFYDDIEIDPNYDYIQPSSNTTAIVKYDTPKSPTPGKVFF
ncbi:sushi: von Willebrand factor type A: EGF and pentraxin domain-containing protein 1-like protein [Leptotrombidium deliense]|uniref:Sushi: von Willebrand factor type A: EGF and pentraxin domain-containing protein 1-like protein n=1 Tax=Leptotrombidium deliense TaxID=299467 RepID=A0A443SVA3_9ACAR|nr:sushi: von Willebrand factor type A: EGF and pentraxin domain-containing protein 1-like protein [Leptotrombidium deliense]